MTSVITVQGPRNPRRRLDGAAPVAVKVAAATVANAAAVHAMMARCSRMTLLRRFHGVTDGVTYTRALFECQPIDRTIDQTFVAWHHSACVGLATLRPDGEEVAHLGVLVEDAWQRTGVGTLLVAALLKDARARGLSSVHADVLGENQFIVNALRRAGQVTVSVTLGTYSVDIDIGAGR